MAACIDRRYEKMLYNYELGMLSEDERRELEHHLLECDSCFDSVKQSKVSARMMRDDPDVRETVQQIVDEAAEVSTPQKQPSAEPELRSRRIRFYLPALAAAAAIFLFFMFTDWQLQFRPSRGAGAHLDRLSVMYFDNSSRQMFSAGSSSLT